MTPAKKSAPTKSPPAKQTAKKASSANKRTAKATTGKAPAAKSSSKKPAARTNATKARSTKASATRSSAKKANGAKPTKSSRTGKSPFPAKFLAQQEQALRDERATYFQQFETLRDEADALVADYEPGDVQFDEESGEGDTVSTERERDLQLSAQARQMVDEIDTALAKIKKGTYGICEVSGEPIPRERLEAIPWARVRVEYKTGGLASRP